MSKCVFGKDGVCYALACYTLQRKCGGRDKNGNPAYARRTKQQQIEETYRAAIKEAHKI